MKKRLIFVLFIIIIFMSGCGSKLIRKNDPSATSIVEDQRSYPTVAYTPQGKTSVNDETKKSVSSNTSENEASTNGKIIEIKEKMFIQQCNDIYTNPSDYKDKTIQLEGMYDSYNDEKTGKTRYAVIRKSPGCCGNDGYVGFEFTYNGQMPKLNDWIKVIGKLKIEGKDNIVLHLSKLEVLSKRGKEFVTN